MPDWSMDGWHTTGKPVTLLQAFGVRRESFHLPQLMPVLSTRAAQVQHPIAVNSGGTQNVNDNAPPPKKGPLEQYAKKLLRDYGWGDQWDAFNNIVQHESGWNPRIANPNTGAFGIAQALGHGDAVTQGTLSDMYGGYGLTPRQSRQANSGDGYWQLVWMMNYIKQTYGSPNAAWAQYYNHPGGAGSY